MCPSKYSKQRGRPRNPELDQRILDVTLSLLASQGFAGMSMEAVAAEAGVPKPTVYRRWKGKADLTTAALARLQAQEPAPRGGSSRSQVIAVLRNFQTHLLRPNGMRLLGTLLAEEDRHPELIGLFRSRIVASRRRMLRAILDQGVEAGEIRREVDLEAAVNLLVGSFYARYLTGQGMPDDWPRKVVATLWLGIAMSSSHGHR